MNNNNDNNKVNFFGLTSFRNQKKKFGIKHDDRRRHFYTIGKTGMGKSNLMENMAIQDIQNGCGLAYVDPHGEGAEKLLDFVPAERIKDVIFFNPADLDFPIAFNVMEKVDFKYRHLVAGGLMGVFKKVWPDVWSARMEYILNNSILALLEYPDSTLLGINRMLADPEYRTKVVAKITDPIVKSFWVTEYARYTQRYEIEATAAIQNKVGQFVSNALIRNIIGQTRSTINMRKIMDEGKILILDLSKGRIGEDNSRLLGALLITKLQLAAMSRVDTPEEERKDFYLYVDEFQNFATESFANILSEARKYRLCLTVGHQYITQMDETVRDAVFGNVGTMAVFRVGAEDAEFLEKEFSPEFTAEDLVNLSKYNVYLKLMIDGIASHPFSAETLAPPAPIKESNKDKIINSSRERYSIKREIVEEKISRWTGVLEKEEFSRVAGGLTGSGQNPKNNYQKNNPQKTFKSAPTKSYDPDSRAKFTAGQGNQPTLYDAICSICGKPTKVVFQPEKDRPVYCKSCLKKMKASAAQIKDGKTAGASGEEKTLSEQGFKIENVPFNPPKKNKPDRNVSSARQSDGSHGGGRSDANGEKDPVAQTRKPKRKEINLSELKKALDESLEKIKETEKEEIKDELKEDLPALRDKAKENMKKNLPTDRAGLPAGRQGIINPGQKIKF